jgi:NH3-dependent NAD+ synthetase
MCPANDRGGSSSVTAKRAIVLLSGGLDSSTVLAMASDTVRSFTQPGRSRRRKAHTTTV